MPKAPPSSSSPPLYLVVMGCQGSSRSLPARTLDPHSPVPPAGGGMRMTACRRLSMGLTVRMFPGGGRMDHADNPRS
jgi:hypothetical protein